MTTLNLPSILVPVVGLIFPAMSFFISSYLKKRFFRSDGMKSH